LVWAIRVTDAFASACLVVFLVCVFFAVSPSLDALSVVVCVAGILSAIVAGGLQRTPIDWPLALYTCLAVLSAVVHPHAVSGNDPSFFKWHPAVHIALLVAYFYSAIWILRTPRRLAALAVLLVVVVSILGLQTSFDQIALGVTARTNTYPSIPQWSGYPEMGALLVQALPFPVAMAIVTRSPQVIVASMVTACVLWLAALGLHSRSADFSVAVTYLALAVVEIVKLRSRRLLTGAAAFTVLFAAGWMTNAGWQIANVSYVVHLRYAVWRNALAIIGDHPWLGVGAGNYTAALRAGYVHSASGIDAHASNMLLHVGAESGIPAVVALLAVWLRALQAGYAGQFPRNTVGIVRMGLLVALTAFLVRSMTEHFLGGLPTSDRMSFLIWTLLAGLIAASRLAKGSDAGMGGAPREVAFSVGRDRAPVDG